MLNISNLTTMDIINNNMAGIDRKLLEKKTRKRTFYTNVITHQRDITTSEVPVTSHPKPPLAVPKFI